MNECEQNTNGHNRIRKAEIMSDEPKVLRVIYAGDAILCNHVGMWDEFQNKRTCCNCGRVELVERQSDDKREL